MGRELKVARTLERFEAFAGALATGLVSVEHVLALAGVCNDRITDALVAIEHQLVQFAKFHRFSVFVTHLRQVAAMLDADGTEPDCGDRDSAAMGRDLEGHLHLKLELTGHNAVEIEAIINTETDRQYRAAVREHEASGLAVPAMGVLRARAIVELIRRRTAVNLNSQKPAVSVTLTIELTATEPHRGAHPRRLQPGRGEHRSTDLRSPPPTGDRRRLRQPTQPGPHRTVVHPGPTQRAGRARRRMHLPGM
ncbi:MAG: hypothetical protein M5U19_22615 [Microthrixaceae bacterium]|nr:hypothetical protein [Microthrixaceae bacterium]